MNEISSLDDLTISDKANSIGYPDYVYLNAAAIFQNIHVEKPQDQRLVGYGTLTNLPMPVFEDEKSQRWSFKLAFSALKYQDFLEDLMIDSCFYPSNPTHDDLTSLVVVMLYDFQDRKFQPRHCLADEEEIEEVREVEKSLNSFKTKIAASLARCRIKLNILTIDYLLPETVRKKQERASTLPLYAWVNTMKTSFKTKIAASLARCRIKLNILTIDYLLPETVRKKQERASTLPLYAWVNTMKTSLEDVCSSLVRDGFVKDKSRSLAAHSVKALMNLDDDVIIGSVASGLTIAHMSALTNQNTSKIFVCGVKTKSQQEQLQHFFTQMQCRNAGLLQDISRGSISEDKLNDLAKHQEQIMTHAVKFPKVQAVVYCTCSVYPEENEDVVKKALEYKFEGNKVQPYR
ncbi:UNVERIFIED_CONTAM: hypothetical protein FKN15_021666 [Acipenser sinensis]